MTAAGSFCLVLHGHVPYVLRHGQWPHGEDWLFEAAAETYLPLLSVLEECIELGVRPCVTVGLTPILLEQLAHAVFKSGFRDYLREHVERARCDRAAFERHGNDALACLASRWEQTYETLAGQFDRIGGDLPRAYAALATNGAIEILSSAATHAYLPLLYEDSSIRAQLRAGLASSRRLLGMAPSGFWLPECAYRPAGEWHAPIAWGQPRYRSGLDELLADEAISHVFVENHLIEQSHSDWVDHEGWRRVGWDEADMDQARGWRSVHEPVRIGGNGESPGPVVAVGRHPSICEQVWSGSIGYPADGTYLEFHKKHGERGLRYWRVTDATLDLGQKQIYEPDRVAGRIHEHCQHFCGEVKRHLHDHAHLTGREGVLVACFDAELFGHWWFEGPRFVRDVLLALNAAPEVDVRTVSDYVERHPPDKAVSLPEGSWGDGGTHQVWANPKTDWMWEVMYRAESTYGRLTYHLPWQTRGEVRAVLEEAGRELLLLQASDWPFAVTNHRAVDYAIRRFSQHAGRFEHLAGIAERLAADPAHTTELDIVQKFDMWDAEVHDLAFPEIDLRWWDV